MTEFTISREQSYSRFWTTNHLKVDGKYLATGKTPISYGAYPRDPFRTLTGYCQVADLVAGAVSYTRSDLGVICSGYGKEFARLDGAKTSLLLERSFSELWGNNISNICQAVSGLVVAYKVGGILQINVEHESDRDLAEIAWADLILMLRVMRALRIAFPFTTSPNGVDRFGYGVIISRAPYAIDYKGCLPYVVLGFTI